MDLTLKIWSVVEMLELTKIITLSDDVPSTLGHDIETFVNSGYYQCVYLIWEQSIQHILNHGSHFYHTGTERNA